MIQEFYSLAVKILICYHKYKCLIYSFKLGPENSREGVLFLERIFDFLYY